MKNVSHKYKTIFVHIPKSAGTSINTALEINKDNRGHKSILEIKKDIPENIFNEYDKIAVIRNTWDRVYSLYRMRVRNEETNLDFHKWLKINLDNNADPYFWINQFNLISDENDNILVDRILRYENLKNDWKEFAKTKDGLTLELLKYNVSNSNTKGKTNKEIKKYDYWNKINRFEKRIIRNRFIKDIIKFAMNVCNSKYSILNRTRKYKYKLSKLNYVSEQIDLLKNKYSDKIAVLVAPGPSLNNYNKNKLKKILSDNKYVVFAVKQAYNWIKEVTDFHILNTWNFDKYNGYDYKDIDTIVFFGLSKSYIKEQAEKIKIKPSVCDFWIPVINPPFVTKSDAIEQTHNFDEFLKFSENYEMMWGTSIMYEQAIPLILHIGCKELITIGWDIGNPELGENQGHAYNDKNSIPSDIEDIKEAIQSTYSLYDWFDKNDITLKILSETNPADERFERIRSLDEL